MLAFKVKKILSIMYHCGDKCKDDEQCVQDCVDANDARTKKYSSKTTMRKLNRKASF